MATNTQTASPAVAALSMAVIDETPFDTAEDKRWLDKCNKTREFIAGHGFLPPWKTVHGTIQRADGKIKPFKIGQWVRNQTEGFDGRKGFATMSEHRRNAFQLIMQIDRHPSHPKHRARMSQPKEQCHCPFNANCNEGKPFSSQVALKAHLQSIHVDECVNLNLNWLCNLFPAKKQCHCPFTANCNEGKPFSSQVALKAHLQSIHVDECVNLDLNWLCNLFPAPAATNPDVVFIDGGVGDVMIECKGWKGPNAGPILGPA